MHTYRITVTQTEYDLIEKNARALSLSRGAYARMLLQEAKMLQEEKCNFGIYIPFNPSNKEKEKRHIVIWTYLPDDLHDFFVKMSSVAKGLTHGQIARIYLMDMLERKQAQKEGK